MESINYWHNKYLIEFNVLICSIDRFRRLIYLFRFG